MKKLIHYILIGIMLNWNVAVFADNEVVECDWKVFEETETYIMENCENENGYQARVRTKPPSPPLRVVDARLALAITFATF